MSLPTLTFRTVTYCTDPRCVSVQRCWRADNERYGNAPGENYGPRCIPVYGPRTYEQGIAEGERRATARIVAWLRATPTTRMWREQPMNDAADCIERGEHRREGKD